MKTRVKLPDGTLKKISEGKRLTGEEKFKNAATFNVRTVPVLLCNNIPLLQDVSHGMLRRLHILPFQKRFEGDEKDETLFPRIWAQELPGILNHFLAGWRRLQTAWLLRVTARCRAGPRQLVDRSEPVHGISR